ncbi:TIGR03086 family protein [Occultella glacieicola]|uniref:TIGR03086 family protein n=1 Tax=Occultella glacieicola TaxID=2518684 RepID=A0ABY2E896_9MICO|nr:TIGR03086 family metal-binding protein [Occultella glacieicola]TDE97346.1 TIGR03086 family protein [Occultella glacieicola]
MSADPATEYREVAAGFTARVEGADPDRWADQSPVPEWTARDVVAHLIEWLPQVLGFEVAQVPPVADDPVAAWRAHSDGVQSLLDDPVRSRAVVRNPNFGEMEAADVIDRLYTGDVFMHTWDLARATGQDDRLDPQRCAAGLAAGEPMEEVMRASGQFGPRVPVPDDASVQDRMLGFIGRDPAWRAPERRAG